KHQSNHLSFQVWALNQSGCPMFTVNHFKGAITYSSKVFFPSIILIPSNLIFVPPFSIYAG
ncbi:hypothetical protein J3R82DRAFT_2858, partial [Butyriboletus roseoflavus]